MRLARAIRRAGLPLALFVAGAALGAAARPALAALRRTRRAAPEPTDEQVVGSPS